MERLGGDAYAEVLAHHDSLIRANLTAHEGREIGTQGDGFFAVFHSASACMAAVIEMQRAFAAHQWPAGEQLRVRMGVHSGEASEKSTGLVGFEIHRAARIAAVAHGGQIVLSATTAALTRDSLPTGAFLRDLGLHRLKDLGRPEQIFQLAAEGLAVEFPPLRSLDNPEMANNLPDYLSASIGREAELAEIRSLIASSRLVTLTGAGGSGKTRLALQAAAELLDGLGEGVFFVDLAVVAEPEQVPGAVAASLGLRQETARPVLGQLLEVLREQRILVLLDNCEHVVDACANLADLVGRSCPKVRLVATSREPLGIGGERVYRVPPLSLPAEDAAAVEDLEGSDAVELFVERARAHDSTFVLDDSIACLVGSICRRLDGVPLAVELATARLSSMSLVHLNERLDQRFRLLTGGARNALPRQRTLEATVDWSFDLLSETERAVLRRLSVFVGGFELDGADAVCGAGDVDVFEVADLLGSLVNKSLIVAERSSGSLRYRLLETIRQYAAHQLVRSGGEAEARLARAAHAEYYLGLAEEAGPELEGPHQGPWLKRLDLEWDNIRAALTCLSAEPDRTEEVLRLSVTLFRFLLTRGHRDAIGHLRAALERRDRVPAALRAHALFVTGSLVFRLLGGEDPFERRTGRELGERALEMARDLDDQRLLSETLRFVSWTETEERSSRATLLGQEALEVARRLDDPVLMGDALWILAGAAPTPEEERELRLEALACYRRAGDVLSVSLALQGLASQAVVDEQLAASRAYREEAIAAAEEIGSSWVLPAFWTDHAIVLLLLGELTEATSFGRKALIAMRRRGRSAVGFTIFVLACCATGTGDYRRAAHLTGAHDVIDTEFINLVHRGSYRWTAPEQRARDDNRARLRQVLGDEEYECEHAVGKALSFEQAIDLALGRANSS